MTPFLSLHAIAVTRGEGLRSELVSLLDACAALSNPDVIELRPSTKLGRDQAGPNPVGRIDATPRCVLRFPRRQIGATCE